ncbi:MAG: DUF4124 domain-containing protein [Gammaproteobacteria bacterium]
MNLKRTSLIILFYFLGISLATAGVYKWVDENNQTHYSSNPGGNQAERLKTHKTSDSIEKQQQDELEALKAKVQQYEDEKTRAAKEAEKQKNIQVLNEYNCKAAKERLNSLKPARVKAATGSGYRFLSEDEKQAEIAKAKLEIGQFCLEEQ